MSLQLIDFEPNTNRRLLNRFIDVPWQLFAGQPHWIPPLRLQVKEDLDTKANPFYRHARIRLWLAERDGKPVGRIAAIVDEAHNTFHDEKTGFFGFFESIDDQEVADKLFAAAANWLKAQGMQVVRGPANPSFNHAVGLQLDSFEREPYIMMNQNPPYYSRLLEQAGFAKAKDLYAYEMEEAKGFPERMTKLAERVVRKNRITFRSIDKKNFDREIALIREIYNDAWEKNWGFVPMDETEFQHTAKGLKDILWPEMCIIAEVDGEAVGFILSVPDVNQVLRKIPNGRLLPFGIFKLLTGLRLPDKGCVNRVRVMTLGVKHRYRRSGLASVLCMETWKRAGDLGIWGGELSWILEDNADMRNAAELMSGTGPYKTYRVYDKVLQ